jgi:hypothetical protein
MAKMGRKIIELDWEKLDMLLKYQASLLDAAELCGCSEDTIERRIREKHNCTFAEYRNKKMAVTRIGLKQKAIKEATAKRVNTSLLIFCLKNLCGWTDKKEVNKSDLEDGIKRLIIDMGKDEETEEK